MYYDLLDCCAEIKLQSNLINKNEKWNVIYNMLN